MDIDLVRIVLLDTLSYLATNALVDEAQGRKFKLSIEETAAFVVPDTVWNCFLRDKLKDFIIVDGDKTTERFNKWIYLVLSVGYLNLAFLGKPLTQSFIDISVSQLANRLIIDNLVE